MTSGDTSSDPVSHAFPYETQSSDPCRTPLMPAITLIFWLETQNGTNGKEDHITENNDNGKRSQSVSAGNTANYIGGGGVYGLTTDDGKTPFVLVTSPTSLRATLSATIDEFPCAMLAKGPACTSTGVRSAVCINVGLIASWRTRDTTWLKPKNTGSSEGVIVGGGEGGRRMFRLRYDSALILRR